MDVRKSLSDIDYKPLYILGSSKNAGKTTVLNKLTAECVLRGIRCGICTIGYDGETKDAVFETAKPAVFVYPGMLVATTDRALQNSNALFQIIKTAPFSTQIGKIVIAEVLREGNVEIIGPDTNSELYWIVEHMQCCNRIYIDGAVNRKTQAFAGAAVLAVSAQLALTPAEAAQKTQYIVQSFLFEKSTVIPSDLKKECYFIGSVEFEQTGRMDECSAVYLPYALTDSSALALIQKKFRGTVILQSPVRFFVNEPVYKRMQGAGIIVKVLKKITLCAVTVNSYSPSTGVSFDPQQFITSVKKLVHIPVFDVLAEGDYDC